MGLLDNIMGAAQREQRGLFDVSGMSPGMGNFPPAQVAEAPQQEKRGGVFGSDYSGEDLITMLLRAAAIAQGDYGGAAQLGSNIGAKARAEAEAAYKRQAELADYEAKRQIDQRYEGPPDPPAIVKNLRAFQQFTPEERAAFEQYQALVNPRYQTGADKVPYQMNAAPLDPNEWEDYVPAGGGASNGTGGFRP